MANIPTFEAQFRVADDGQRVFDTNGIPNGILAGNQDVGHTQGTADYGLFQKYFGKHRYKYHYWYGEESKEDNSLNYQLITLGNQDFVVVNVGYGVENYPETMRWVKEILDKYNHRTAIVCTHAYLGYTGDHINERMNELYDNVLREQNNVRLILCGHYDATVRNTGYVNGRLITEMMADYQSLDPSRNGGGGYTRVLTFDNNKLISETYSPILDSTAHYDEHAENFEIPFEYVNTMRALDCEASTLVKGAHLGDAIKDMTMVMTGDL